MRRLKVGFEIRSYRPGAGGIESKIGFSKNFLPAVQFKLDLCRHVIYNTYVDTKVR